MFKNAGLLTAYYGYKFADDGGATGAVDLSAKRGKSSMPAGAVPVRGYLIVREEFDSATDTATIELGSTDDPNGYLTSQAEGALGAGAVTELDGALLETVLGSGADALDVAMTIGGEALTQGEADLVIEFHLPEAEG